MDNSKKVKELLETLKYLFDVSEKLALVFSQKDIGELMAGYPSEAIQKFTDGDLDYQLQVSDMALAQMLLGNIKDNLADVVKPVNKEFDSVRKFVLPATLEQNDMTGAKIDGVGTVSLRSDIYVARMPEKTTDDVSDWLVDLGRDDMIQETVNASSLKSLIKKRIKEGEEDAFPDDLIKVTPFDFTVILK